MGDCPHTQHVCVDAHKGMLAIFSGEEGVAGVLSVSNVRLWLALQMSPFHRKYTSSNCGVHVGHRCLRGVGHAAHTHWAVQCSSPHRQTHSTVYLLSTDGGSSRQETHKIRVSPTARSKNTKCSEAKYHEVYMRNNVGRARVD